MPGIRLIVTGYITDDGHEKQYQAAYKTLAPFKGRLFIAHGNHDQGALGGFFEKRRVERFDLMLSLPLEQGGRFFGTNSPVVNVFSEGRHEIMLIALDTNLETDHPWDFACGEVGESQLSALTTILCTEKARTAVKILFLQHHPFMHNNAVMELMDAESFMRMIYDQIDVLAFGHKHVFSEWQGWGGIPWIIASDSAPGKERAHEIVVDEGGRSGGVRGVAIQGAWHIVRGTITVSRDCPEALRGFGFG